MIKRTIGLAILAALAAPFIHSARQAAASVPTHLDVCYTGRLYGRLGIEIHASQELAELLVRSRQASYAYAETFRTYQGYDVCIPLYKKSLKE